MNDHDPRHAGLCAPACNCPALKPGDSLFVHVVGCPLRVARLRKDNEFVQALNAAQEKTILNQGAMLKDLREKLETANDSRKMVIDGTNEAIRILHKIIADQRAELDTRVQEFNRTMEWRTTQINEKDAVINRHWARILEQDQRLDDLHQQLAGKSATATIKIAADTGAWQNEMDRLGGLLEELGTQQEITRISDDLRHLSKQGGPAWSCLIELADRVQKLAVKLAALTDSERASAERSIAELITNHISNNRGFFRELLK
jgi:chromosome segregation ATPase